ncbi:MAG: GAF domain-containing protein [Wenzhouxiangellaceae bacterium]|nr:GAF domain-containing protein [Wenzhouxiangellaceae bacterium]MBS3746651.1 GAF domain-containing protein [Wenzhouxiangellaceae bacterium]MBS3823465.1 GAF domain-containing protein [Wenzhouxiangellaceae bacterium]
MPSVQAGEFESWDALAQQARGLLSGEPHRIANAANLAALIFNGVPDLNWAGFYFVEGDELIVGPFQGQPACVRIAPGNGVCGTAMVSGETQRVEDVNAFAGHIACDPNSRSEVVVPLIESGRVVGVLDIDSPIPGRFSDADARGFEQLAAIYLASLAR